MRKGRVIKGNLRGLILKEKTSRWSGTYEGDEKRIGRMRWKLMEGFREERIKN